MLNEFVELSQELLGIDQYYLWGTGRAAKYYDEVERFYGQARVQSMINKYTAIRQAADFEQRMYADLWSDEDSGPIVREITLLWLTPNGWYSLHGQPQMPDPYAYGDGLLWPAVGSHPPGAKAPGYNSWTEKPKPLPIYAHSSGATPTTP